MICEYNFIVEYYYILVKVCFDCLYNVIDCDCFYCVVVDGIKRGIIIVNRMVFGFGIYVCNKV